MSENQATQETTASKSSADIAAALEGLENGAELLSAYQAMEAKAKSDAARLKGQVTRLTGANARLTQELSAASESRDKLMDFAGVPADTVDINAALEEMKQRRGKSNEGAALLQSRNNELTRRLKALEAERDAAKKEAAENLQTLHGYIRDAAVSAALKKAGALEPETLAPLFQKQVTIENGLPVYAMPDGSQVTVEEGISSFLDAHPRLVANPQNAGAGSAGGRPRRLSLVTMSQADYEQARREGRI